MSTTRLPLQPELPLYGSPDDGPAIVLGDERIAYTLRRTQRRRTISLLIDERGLRVAAPLKASQQAIDAMLREHAAWVIRKVRDWRRKQPPPRLWRSGEQIMLYGDPVTLEVIAGVPAPRLENGRLLYGPAAPGPDNIESGIHDWLKQQALALYTRRCHEFSSRLGLAAPTVRLSNARTRWGSCHASGRISMNWRLVQTPMAWIDYVAAHEVAHLRQMNHSPAFWKTVGELVADYAERRAALRREAHRYLLL
ncbi:MAG: M48 family metallopeptidase [Betaproteobacteria bacterium]|nr:M48 family metallopeptidase [Betaproteobacteria bacterium]